MKCNNESMRVKICGITSAADARLVTAAGADALGVIMVPASRRFVTAEAAAEIMTAAGPFITRVGVFRDAPLPAILAAVRTAGLDVVQLHGNESPAVVAELRPHVRVIKALSFAPGLSPDDAAAYGADAVMLDGASPGSGLPFDWALAGAFRGMPGMILAGGLSPDSIEAAVRALAPAGLDVASGVEVAPGVKDARLVGEFVERARAVSPRVVADAQAHPEAAPGAVAGGGRAR